VEHLPVRLARGRPVRRAAEPPRAAQPAPVPAAAQAAGAALPLALAVEVDGEVFHVRVLPDGVETEPSAAVQPARPRPAEPPVGAVVAEMAGMILTFRLGIGDAVSEGDVICVVEAMKMMREVRSPHTGVVREIHVGDGETIDAGDLLAVIAADAP